jgi:tRNA threonylcarbamoyladenosine biosynthesis protein TsaE
MTNDNKSISHSIRISRSTPIPAHHSTHTSHPTSASNHKYTSTPTPRSTPHHTNTSTPTPANHFTSTSISTLRSTFHHKPTPTLRSTPHHTHAPISHSTSKPHQTTISQTTFISHSTDETLKFASTFGKQLKNGTVVILDGELGSGKTIFTKGIGIALNIKNDIKSPTYVIANSYNKGKFNHIDAYRIKSYNDFETLGIDFDNSISVIEWGSKFKNYFKNNLIITVKISKNISNKNIRNIVIK